MLARAMSRPRVGDEGKLKRVLRYLRGTPQVTIRYDYQDCADGLTLSTDSDWANCRDTRRSCSGGIVQRGTHLLHFWTKLQGQVSASSGEAELFSANKGLSEFVYLVNLYRELTGSASWGNERLIHRVDASACRSMLLRSDVGGIKHLEVRDMWGQDIVQRYRVSVVKIPRAENVADALASPGDRGDIQAKLESVGVSCS